MSPQLKTKSLPPTDYDVVIAGGGLAGLSLACALSQIYPWRVALIEAQEAAPTQPASFDERVLALSAMTVRILKVLQLWPELADEGAAIRQIHISDQASYGKTRLYAKEHNLSEFGRVLPARRLGQALQQRAGQLDLDWYQPAHIVATDVKPHLRTVTLDSGQKLSCQLLVVAEGADSPTRQLLGMAATEHDYQQVAIIANIKTDKPHDNWAFERFTPHGPLALLPMTDNRRSLVWTHSPERAQQLMALNEDEFHAQLQQAMGYRFGVLERVGQRAYYPLQLKVVEQSISHRALVLGNAAHTLHPIAGQGFNLGLRDVMELALLLKQAQQPSAKPIDTGNQSLLAEYLNNRQKDQLGVAQATHLLAQLFSNEIAPLQLGRSLGLSALSHIQPAKSWLIQKAMGQTALSRVPEELSGE